jgi:hypothetical protein
MTAKSCKCGHGQWTWTVDMVMNMEYGTWNLELGTWAWNMKLNNLERGTWSMNTDIPMIEYNAVTLLLQR